MKFYEFLEGRTIYQNGYAALKPEVSVVMPTYCRNAEGLLKRCLQSVLEQSFTNFEFIIVDDGSTDGSQDVIINYAKNDPRIVYVRHDINSGLPAVRTNEGILLARAPYIMFVFDDNVWNQDCLEVMLSAMLKNPADVQHSNTNMVIDVDNTILLGRFPLTLELLQHLNTIPNGTILCRREYFEKFGLYDPHISMRRICDWDLWLRSLKSGATFHHVDMTLSTELGPSSPVSLGRSVNWDYKTTYSYMVDERRMQERIQALRPETIMSYDVFDPNVLIPYFKNINEWKHLEDIVYTPFFEGHPHYQYESIIVHNRLFDSDFSSSPLSPLPMSNVWKNRLRILLVSNVFDSVLQSWKKAIETECNAIVLTCGEWQVSAFTPEDIDLVILFDCTVRFLTPYIQAFRDMEIPVGYVISRGVDPSKAERHENQVVKDFAKVESIREAFGMDLYFPHQGVPWSKLHQIGAQELIHVSDMVIYLKDVAEPPFKILKKCITVPMLSEQEHARYIANVIHALILQKKLIGIVSDKKIESMECLVLLNSCLLAGSEVYGLLLMKILADLGFNVRGCIPVTNHYGSDGNPYAVNSWLAERGLPAVIEAPYGVGAGGEALFSESVMARTSDFVKWLDKRNTGMVICSSFIPEVAVAMKNKNIPMFFALFQPIGYIFEEMTFLRDVASGIMSDCEWSKQVWKQWFAPPLVCIPSVVEDEMFKIRNQNLATEPICIAIGGTLQPRKRQLEALYAIREIIIMGYDIKINVYGYKLELLSDYISEINNLVNSPELKERVEIHGLVDFSSIVENNHVILSASSDESLPQTLLFAMAAGLIAVACPAGGIPELVRDGKTGFLAKDFSVSAVVQVLLNAIKQKEDWSMIIENSRKMIAENYSERAVAKKLMTFLNEGVAIALSSGRYIVRDMNISQSDGLTQQIPSNVLLLQKDKKHAGSVQCYKRSLSSYFGEAVILIKSGKISVLSVKIRNFCRKIVNSSE